MNGNAVFTNFRSMEILLYIAASYLAFTVVVFARNWFEFKSLSAIEEYTTDEELYPLVSICIPARNEESVIERCVTSALKQSYPNFEVLVLNDNSTDNTTAILDELSGIINTLHHIQGKEKPEDWLGKPWACHQLSKHSSGEYLLFIDADVWLEEDAVSKAVNALQRTPAITVWPKQVMKTFWERTVIPMIYYGLYTLLPAKYVEQDPKWLPAALRPVMSSKFAAACGQFIAFRRETYDDIGGHSSVKGQIVEDVELARVIRKKRHSLTMYDGVNTVNCRMYRSHNEIFEGLRKNFFVGFGRNILLFLGMAFLQATVYILPFVLIFTAGFEHRTLAFVLIGIIIVQRWMLDFRFKWHPWYSLLQPVTTAWFQILALRCLWDHFTGQKATWKGRKV